MQTSRNPLSDMVAAGTEFIQNSLSTHGFSKLAGSCVPPKCAPNFREHWFDYLPGFNTLVPLPRGYDSLTGLQGRQAIVVNEQFDAASDACLPADQSIAFEIEDHLMDGRSRDGEEALHVALGRSAAIDQAVGPDEGEILTLLVGKARAG